MAAREPLPREIEHRLIAEYIARRGVTRVPIGVGTQEEFVARKREMQRRQRNARHMDFIASNRRTAAALKGTP